jgi:hypothetical protein
MKKVQQAVKRVSGKARLFSEELDNAEIYRVIKKPKVSDLIDPVSHKHYKGKYAIFAALFDLTELFFLKKSITSAIHYQLIFNLRSRIFLPEVS